MKAIVQRVLSASVTVDNQVVSSISSGLLVLAAVAPTDTAADIASTANRILKLKLWPSPPQPQAPSAPWKASVLDQSLQILLVSQFTLLANTKKGNKPDFHGACAPDVAKELYARLVEKAREIYMKENGIGAEEAREKVQDGVFGAMMQVALVNDGPVTVEINTASSEGKEREREKQKEREEKAKKWEMKEKKGKKEKLDTPLESVKVKEAGNAADVEWKQVP